MSATYYQMVKKPIIWRLREKNKGNGTKSKKLVNVDKGDNGFFCRFENTSLRKLKKLKITENFCMGAFCMTQFLHL